MANIHRTPEQWQQIVKQHASSGLQITVFCKQQKLNPSSFYAWRKRLTLTNKPTPVEEHPDDWVNIVPDKVVPSKCWDMELSLPNGVVLRMMNN